MYYVPLLLKESLELDSRSVSLWPCIELVQNLGTIKSFESPNDLQSDQKTLVFLNNSHLGSCNISFHWLFGIAPIIFEFSFTKNDLRMTSSDPKQGFRGKICAQSRDNCCDVRRA